MVRWDCGQHVSGMYSFRTKSQRFAGTDALCSYWCGGAAGSRCVDNVRFDARDAHDHDPGTVGMRWTAYRYAVRYEVQRRHAGAGVRNRVQKLFSLLSSTETNCDPVMRQREAFQLIRCSGQC